MAFFNDLILKSKFNKNDAFIWDSDNLKLKAVNNWDEPNEGATNESGFTAIPAGTRSGHGGDFHGLEREASFWASTYIDSLFLHNLRGLSAEKSSIRRDRGGANDGNSIRCIINKDCTGEVGGSAVVDECGDCVGGDTGETACVQDCAGTWGGTAIEDCTGVCG